MFNNDRPFKFYTKRKREEYKRFIHTMAHNWAWSGAVTKFVIYIPLIIFEQLTVEYSNYTQSLLGRITTTFIYKNL